MTFTYKLSMRLARLWWAVFATVAAATACADQGVEPVDPPAALTLSGCLTSSTTWTNLPIAPRSGAFTLRYEATPAGAAIDGVTGLSSGPARSYADLAVIVRFNTSGTIDARHGGAYTAAAAIRYTAGTTYRVRLVVDVARRRYAAYVATAGGPEQTIGTDLAFRTEQSLATVLANLATLTSGGGTHTVCQVDDGSAPAAVDVTPAAVTLAAGATAQLQAAVTDAAQTTLTGQLVTWRSSDTLTATITAAGLVLGVAPGTAYAVGASGGARDSALVTVTAPCPTSSGAWSNTAFSLQNGAFTARFDATPGAAAIDGVAGLSRAAATSYGDLAAIVRFNSNGAIDARNGAAYAAATSIPYVAGRTYGFRLAVDVTARRYSAYVTPAGGTEQTIGTGYAFRTEQSGATALDHLAARAGGGTLTVCGLTISAAAAPVPPAPAGGGGTPRAGWYVAPNGASGNDGSQARPWSLSHALSGAAGRIAAGDTVWLLGGTYTGVFRTALAGSPGKPIVFRQYPGQRATLDGGLRVDGPDVVFWGFEIRQSNPLAHGTLPALLTYGARSKFINLVIHDAAQQGISFWDGADDAEVYGSIVYNNGLNENKDHGIYVHNTRGTKIVRDNVFFNNLAYGIHVYATASNSTQRNVHVIGNVAFNNGSISTQWPERVNLLVGGEVRYEGMRVVDNMLFFSGSTGRNLWVGYKGANGDVEVRRNTVWGGASALEVTEWERADVRDNVLAGPEQLVDLRDATPLGHTWSGNRYYRSASAAAWRFAGLLTPLSAWQLATGLGQLDHAQSSPPGTPTVFVRPNQYEAGRAHVVVYNWAAQGTVTVDLSSVLALGQRFEVRNVQDVFGPPVVSGVYGGAVTLPMNGVAPPARLGRSTPTPPRTGPRFDVFVVTAVVP